MTCEAATRAPAGLLTTNIVVSSLALTIGMLRLLEPDLFDACLFAASTTAVFTGAIAAVDFIRGARS